MCNIQRIFAKKLLDRVINSKKREFAMLMDDRSQTVTTIEEMDKDNDVCLRKEHRRRNLHAT